MFKTNFVSWLPDSLIASQAEKAESEIQYKIHSKYKSKVYKVKVKLKTRCYTNFSFSNSRHSAIWNYLFPVTRSSSTITTFNTLLKTELFSAAYDTV